MTNGRHGSLALLFCLLLPLPTIAAQQPDTHASQDNRPTPKKKESLAKKLLRVSGISASPSTLKGPGDEVTSGEIWIVELASGKTRKLVDSGGFRSPIFLQGDDVLALKTTSVFRISAGGAAKRLYDLPTASKLVGANLDDPSQVLLVTEDESGHAGIAWLAIATGKLTTIPFDSTSSEDREMLQSLRGWDRVYANQTLFVRKLSKQGMGGNTDWVDVFVKSGSAEAVNASHCDGINCGQPSLSLDGRSVVFIKSDQQ
jgi:hypothetical protein